jgi:hypothetical protein
MGVKTITADELSDIQSNRLMLVWLIEMDLVGGTVYLSAGPDLEYGGQVWLGASHVGSVSYVDDSPGERKAMTFTLRGLASSELSLAMSDAIRGRDVMVYEALCNGDTWQVRGLYEIFSGTISQAGGQVGGGTGVVQVTVEHSGTTYARTNPLRYTDGDQQRLHAGDRSLQFVVSQANHVDVWPAANFFRV